jgi:hypothetical protein
MSVEDPSQRDVSSDGDTWLGRVLGGRYRLEVLLGKGTMGRVYRAEHVLMHKPLAVKILNAEHAKNPELVARFEREAIAAANIEHANVVAATDCAKLEDGTVYLALELVEGKNLRAEIARGALEIRRALHIARQIAAGLAAAHSKNIVHRDLKPENVVLVEKEGDPDFVKILDFGIAKLAPESGKNPLTRVGVVLGTLDYMAPEQALGQPVDHRADLYALGVVTYEMLCGACPFEGESSSAILALQLKKPPPPLSERLPGLSVPPAVEALVGKLLAKDRNERPPVGGFGGGRARAPARVAAEGQRTGGSTSTRRAHRGAGRQQAHVFAQRSAAGVHVSAARGGGQEARGRGEASARGASIPDGQLRRRGLAAREVAAHLQAASATRLEAAGAARCHRPRRELGVGRRAPRQRAAVGTTAVGQTDGGAVPAAPRGRSSGSARVRRSGDHLDRRPPAVSTTLHQAPAPARAVGRLARRARRPDRAAPCAHPGRRHEFLSAPEFGRAFNANVPPWFPVPGLVMERRLSGA